MYNVYAIWVHEKLSIGSCRTDPFRHVLLLVGCARLHLLNTVFLIYVESLSLFTHVINVSRVMHLHLEVIACVTSELLVAYNFRWVVATSFTYERLYPGSGCGSHGRFMDICHRLKFMQIVTQHLLTTAHVR